MENRASIASASRFASLVLAIFCGASIAVHAQDNPKKSEKPIIKVGKIDPRKYTSALNSRLRPNDAKFGASYWNGIAFLDGCICDSDNNLWCKDANGDWQYAGDCHSAKTRAGKMPDKIVVKVEKIDPRK